MRKFGSNAPLQFSDISRALDVERGVPHPEKACVLFHASTFMHAIMFYISLGDMLHVPSKIPGRCRSRRRWRRHYLGESCLVPLF